MSDLKDQYKSIKKEINQAIQRVLDSSVFIRGKEVESFEKELALFCQKKYAISVNSGTDALFLSLKALGIGPGDEVITSPFTFVATAGAIANCGARPIFVDIEKNSFNINPDLIKKAVTKRTKAIIPIHLFGQLANVDRIKKYNLPIVEDAAQAIGNKMIGDLACYSFFPSKNLGAYGDGGAIVTDNEKLAEKIRLLKNHGSSSNQKYLNLIVGTNSRLDALQAAILRVKLKYLKKWNERRKQIAENYNKSLSGIGDIIIPKITKDHVFNQYTIRTKKRDKLKKHIPYMIYYPLPLHLQPAFKYLNHKKGDFPEAEKASREVLSLPIYPELSRKDQDLIIKRIKEFYEK
ncbi:MAG: DegT/DnrJ/EryC1/StrS family aminotransferase [Candidatus Pacebacteria bacterium]|nr:DegT/DnrJ/EryC1/StrS family aminotransferase [Candidatus Paceibacterota bacterium]